MNILKFILIDILESNKNALKPFPTLRLYSKFDYILLNRLFELIFKFIMLKLNWNFYYFISNCAIYLVEITKKLSDILDRCATTTQPSTVLLYTIFVDCFFFTLASIRATATVCRSLFIWIYKYTNTNKFHLHAHTIITTSNAVGNVLS